jgi:hypothetical protein
VQVKWGELFQVAEVSLAFGVGIAVVFTLGVLGLGRMREGRSRAVALSGSAVAFALCAAAVAYGLYLLIPQFH